MKELERDLEASRARKVSQGGAVEGMRVSPHIYLLKSDLDTFATALRAALE
ncbi:hypothetical protein SAMCFNEI73_pC0121 (plasmid) [Sinorhizobium americanum]|uniref:Uncharacterized protein n=1 Tax=Sinorhizobium americanum TaxID=194963 RepID=A0A1L3LUS7_9HYPH|nr:hypothetical protein SAMCFNEI73_pC0121 [Sinorhizobium americanum]